MVNGGNHCAPRVTRTLAGGPPLFTKKKREEKLRYLHRNPVKRGLVQSPELWRWSSYRAYALGEPGPVKIDEWRVLKMKIHPPAA